METYAFASAVHGYHVYKDVWKPSIGEKLVAKQEFNNPMDKHAMKVVKDDETVGHLPCKFSRIAWYVLARSGEISVEVIGRRRHCKQLCGGMEIPCQLEFNCSNKAQMKRLKELLASKIQVWNLKMQTNGSFRSHHFCWEQWSTTGFNMFNLYLLKVFS